MKKFVCDVSKEEHFYLNRKFALHKEFLSKKIAEIRAIENELNKYNAEAWVDIEKYLKQNNLLSGKEKLSLHFDPESMCIFSEEFTNEKRTHHIILGGPNG